MSWASSFMAKKQEAAAVGPVPTTRFESSSSSAGRFGDSQDWKTVSGSAFGRQNRSDGGDNPFSRQNRSDGGDSAFSRPRRNEDSHGGWGAARPNPPEEKKVDVNSESDFPSLGGKKVAEGEVIASAARAGHPKGFSRLASSWAAQDAAEREAAAKAKAETDKIAALEAKEAARYGNLFSRLGKSQTAYVSRDYEYDDYVEEREWQASGGRNAMLDGGNEDNEGWSEK